MQHLRVGDRVLTVGPGGSMLFEDVYFFGHADPSTTELFVGLRFGTDVLHLSSDHFVPVCRSGASPCRWLERVEVYAQDVQVGDSIWIRSSTGLSTSKVTDILTSHLSGLFNPYTITGNIVVDGVVASCHSSWILDSLVPKGFQPWLPAVYQAVFLLNRWMYWLFGAAAADAFDMNNPQASPETLGCGPAFLGLVYGGFLPASLAMLFLSKRRK